MEEKNTTFTLRIPEGLKKAFDIAAKAEDLSGAQAVRRFMRSYVEHYMKNHAQKELPLNQSKGQGQNQGKKRK